MKFDLKTILILGLAACCLFLWFFPQDTPVDESKYIEIGGKKYKQLLETKEIRYIHVQSKGPAYVPAKNTVKLSEPQDLPQKIDTAAIIAEYYTKNYFEDRQAIDTIGFVTIKDTVYNNSIFSRQLEFDYELPVIENTIIAEQPPRNKVYLGGGLNFDKVDFINSGYGGALFKTKKDRIIGVQLGATNIDGQLGAYYGGAIYFPISFRKNR